VSEHRLAERFTDINQCIVSEQRCRNATCRHVCGRPSNSTAPTALRLVCCGQWRPERDPPVLSTDFSGGFWPPMTLTFAFWAVSRYTSYPCPVGAFTPILGFLRCFIFKLQEPLLDRQTDGRTDRRTDGQNLQCSLRSLGRPHKQRNDELQSDFEDLAL